MQRLRNAIRKMAAIGTGVAFLGATLTSAVALDLSEYPGPFVDDNGVFDESTAIVVGDNAAASDTLGAVDIATNLQFMAKTPVSSGAGTVTVSGGVTEDIPLGAGIANSTTFAFDWNLDDSDIASFMDTQIQFQGADYDVHDELVFPTTQPMLTTSLYASEDDYESNVFMEIKKKSIYYVLFFDENDINVSKATTNEPLEVNFLGKKLKIVDADFTSDTENKFKAFVGAEYFMDVGDVVTVEGKKVTLNNVGSDGSVMIDVDGTIGVIPSSTTETINGVEIRNSETFYEDTKAERAANLVVGEDAEATFVNGDPYVGEDELKPNWKWWISDLANGPQSSTSLDSEAPGQGVINASATTGPIIGVYNYFRAISSSDNPAGIGECYDLPNNYASICLDSLTVADDDYLTLTIELVDHPDLDESKHNGITAANTAVKISTPLDTALKLPANGLDTNNDTKEHKTSQIWITSDSNTARIGWHVFYWDPDASPQLQWKGYDDGSEDNGNGPGWIAQVNYKDTKDNNINITIANSSATVMSMGVSVDGDSATELANNKDNIFMNWTYAVASGPTSLGITKGEEENVELEWGAGANGNSGALVEIGNKDEDHRTLYGIIIKDPKSNGASDQVVLEIPADQVQANVVIKGSAATVAGGAVSYIPAQITIDTMLSSEVAGAESAHQLILVGGPCANPTVESVSSLGVTCSGWSLSAGEAVLKLAANGDKVALLVAGTDAIDTRMAAKVVANYKDYDLKGSEQTVTGTLSSPTLK